MASSPFTLAVCVEMVLRDLPLADRIRHVHDLGFAAEIWDWTTKDLDELAGLAESGVRFTSMTGYVDGELVDPDGAEALLASAARSIEASRRLGAPNLNLHGTGLDGDGPAGAAGRGGHGPDVGGGRRDTLARVAELGEREGVVFTLENLNTEVDHPGTPFARAADTRALVAAVGSPHLRMNLDLYHAQIGEGNLIQLVRDSVDLPRRGPGGRRAGAVRAGDRRDQLSGGRAGAGGGWVRRVVGLEAFASGDDDLALERFRAAFTLD